MHELSLMTGVFDVAVRSAKEAGAVSVLSVSLSIGRMSEVIPDALEFAFEALSELEEYSLMKDAELKITYVEPKSVCLSCGEEFEHDRFHMRCPYCKGIETKLIAGKEMEITSLEVDLPD